MRIPIRHSLPREDVRQRLKSRMHEIADFMPGGMADVTTDWPSEDRFDLTVTAMGIAVASRIEIEEEQVVFTVELPAALSFVEPMIRSGIEAKGRKLLT